jgi:hypothetical protein
MPLIARFLACLIAGALTVIAQSTDASVSGTAVDPTGASVPGVSIVITNARTGVAFRTMSNDVGAYSFPTLPAGEYRLEAEKQGFRRLTLGGIRLEVGARVNIDLRLELGATTEIVEVSADADNPVSYVTASMSGVMTERKVLDLPVSSRNVLNLTTTMAGTLGSNFNGTRRGNLNIQMDGINVQDARINVGVSSTIFASVDRVAEFRVVTQPVDAELGRGSGNVQMITRSGTNEFHGSLFNFHRNTALNANTWFNNANGRDPRTGEPVSPRENLIRNQFGGRVGGPVIRNRTFFHFLYEGQKIRQRETVTSTVWTAPMRQGLFRFFPGVQNGNLNAARPTVDENGNPVSPTGAALTTFNIFQVDPARPGMDSTGLVKRYIDAMPLPNNFRAGDGLNTAGFTWQRPYRFDENNFNVKFDHLLSDRHQCCPN